MPLLKDENGAIYVDALLLKPENIGRVFSLARAYFMVDMEVPSAYVAFLQTILPSKPKAELYTMLGLQKQGKTHFFRDLMQHMQALDRHASCPRPARRGMVMVVFTLPVVPLRLQGDPRLVRAAQGQRDRRSVQEKYLLVKYHDRAGRMADTLEYSNVAFPLDRFDPALLAELQRVAPSCIEIDGDRLVIKHLYIERRMMPIDLYIRDADEARPARTASREYGAAIKELASANIFPGDMLLKNFGVTRYGRVVFYDYDEIALLTECNFRRLPEAEHRRRRDLGRALVLGRAERRLPREFPTFLFRPGRAREIFMELHGDLADPRAWTARQDRCRAGIQEDMFPYARSIRFCERYGNRERRSRDRDEASA